MKTTKHKLLDYRLTDVLEMKCSKHRKLLKAIKEKLLSRPIQDANLHLLPSFALDRNLVVIQNRDSKEAHQLYLLDSHKGSYREFILRSR